MITENPITDEDFVKLLDELKYALKTGRRSNLQVALEAHLNVFIKQHRLNLDWNALCCLPENARDKYGLPLTCED